MKEKRVWIGLAVLFAIIGVPQLFWKPSRFGGIFLLALAIGCMGEWLMLRGREKHKACRILSRVGRVLFALFVLSFAAEPRTEAAAMQDYMIAHGADAERLILENKSSTTIQNIANAKKLLPEGAAVAVITNDYHLARARRLLAHAGLGDAGVPAKTPYPGQWMAVRCREYCSIMGLMFTGRW